MSTWFLLLVGTAAAAPLSVHPDSPPVVLQGQPHMVSGAVRLAFPDGLEATSLPAVIVTLEASARVPASLRHVGESLGRSQRSWRVALEPDDDPVRASLRWQQVPGVSTAFPDLLLPRTTTAFSDPWRESQWYLDELGMDALWDVSTGDPSVAVAVIDSAIELSHPDLADAIDDPYDAYSDDDDPSPNPDEFCYGGSGICDEHGTAVAGIIGARGNNDEGIVGLCPECRVVPIKLLGEGDSWALSRDIAAFEHAIAANVAVINNSWGFIDPTPVPAPLAEVIHRAATETRGGKGALVVFAAGNDDREIGNDELQALPDVLCVGATDRYGLPTQYTNRGDSLAISAPSATVTTSHSGGYTTSFGGTSAAAPVVSGFAGWVVSQAPELTAAELKQLFIDTATPSPLTSETGHHPEFGWGQLDPWATALALGVVEDVEEPSGACACQTGSAGGLGTLLMLLPFVVRRRRRL